jgi:hypothetical protein
MKLATFAVRSEHHVGVVDGDEVTDLTAADPSLATMIDLPDLRRPGDSGRPVRVGAGAVVAVRAVAAPRVPRPPKFLAIGYNNAAPLRKHRAAGFYQFDCMLFLAGGPC